MRTPVAPVIISLWHVTLKLQVQASLVIQWLRICLPMQGTQVQSLIQEDPTCHRAAKPVHQNYCALEPQSPCSVTREATTMRSLLVAMKTQCSQKVDK